MATLPHCTGVEYVLDDHDTIISKGDLQGKITYVNRDFIQISGYAEAEVMGGPQSILAHPETPPQVFQDFLRTLKANKTWTGVTKGRRKNGDFFWVEMIAAPIFEQHRQVGCITIRAKPAPRQVRAAELAYRAMQAGSKDVTLDQGRIVHRSLRRHWHAWSRWSAMSRMQLLAAVLALLFITLLAAVLLPENSVPGWLPPLCALGAALCPLAPFLLARGVTAPLAGLQRQIDEMSEGNLAAGIEADGGSEIERVRHSLRILQTNLKLLVSQIKETTELANGGALRMAADNADLLSRTEEQAGALRHAAASLERLTATVGNNAAAAQEANALAAATSGTAANGQQAVGAVISTMGAIQDSSRRIAHIISVIDGIAFQTNILALNAAVEAARAGDQGRGFAVVASEVRSLAGRCTSAASEIKILIGASVQQVEAGSKLVDEAGAAISDIVRAVDRVSCVMQDISTASGEQRIGIGQVNAAVLRMDGMTRQNARLAGQAEAASVRMQEQAGKLARLVSAFKLSASERAVRENCKR
ncbi:methyl-accepting chemotaxis protein [Duganella radicis]|uniref:PAS domain S-box protein n=1 Tax=Duganella radicis TaxID=551988 RepID=A0A6L6PHG3_9BURK|nr:methyl-accepting chemotaxis protein [Duganella radicis]MTV37735.1 PAS domain S-box protein [Duganella radicis]